MFRQLDTCVYLYILPFMSLLICVHVYIARIQSRLNHQSSVLFFLCLNKKVFCRERTIFLLSNTYAMYSVNSLYCIVLLYCVLFGVLGCTQCTVYCCTSMYFVQVFCVQVCMVYKNVLCTSMYFCTVSTIVVLFSVVPNVLGTFGVLSFCYTITYLQRMLSNLDCPSFVLFSICKHLALIPNSILLKKGNTEHELCQSSPLDVHLPFPPFTFPPLPSPPRHPLG